MISFVFKGHKVNNDWIYNGYSDYAVTEVHDT
jgi:hypothetical protein